MTVSAVVCSKAETARWARQPIEIGRPGLVCLTVTPVVLGPGNVPAVTSVAEAAADLPLLAAALDAADLSIAEQLSEFTEVGLGSTPGSEIWKEMMASETHVFMSETRAWPALLALPGDREPVLTGAEAPGCGAYLPAGQLPVPLLAQVNDLHARLGYPPLAAA